MKSRKFLVFAAILMAILYSCEQKVSIKQGAFTAINPLSYTDVTYKSNRDTVLVSTFNGRIAERINGHKAEKLLINLPDEIYNIAYNAKDHRIYASTLNSGIAIIDSEKRTVIDYISLDGTWISDLFLSTNGNLLVGRSAHRQNYIWDLKNNYAPVKLPENLINFRIMGLTETGNVIVKGNGKYVFWNPLKHTIEKEIVLAGNLADIDASGNMLLFNEKDFKYYNASEDAISFEKHHEDWPYYWKEQDTIIRIPLQLSLTVGRLTDEYIFTAGVDRSIRKWSKTNGQHLEDIIEHKATISAIDFSADRTQLVTVDLKGGIRFSEIKEKAVNKE